MAGWAPSMPIAMRCCLGGTQLEASPTLSHLLSDLPRPSMTFCRWDTDMFPTNPALSTYLMKRVIEQGGLQPGGLNFDAKVQRWDSNSRSREASPCACLSPAGARPSLLQLRRESTDMEDLFIGHVNGMDCYARGLRAAAKIIAEGKLDAAVKQRYSGFTSTAIGKKMANGKATLSEMAAHAKKQAEPEMRSGKQEKLESIFNTHAYRA